MRAGLLLAVALASGLCAACADDAAQAPSDSGARPSRDASVADGGSDADSLDAEQDAAPEPRALVHSALWERVAWGEDPFDPSGGAEPPLPCPSEASGEENLGGELVFFVRTERCASLTVRQASRSELRAGERLRIRAYYFPLTAPEDSTAHLIVQVGETRVWERELPIPSPAAEIADEWEVDQDYAAGTPVLFHVNNHGNNEYTLISLDVL